MRTSLALSAKATPGAANDNAARAIRERRENILIATLQVSWPVAGYADTSRWLMTDLAVRRQLGKGVTSCALAAFFKRPQAAMLKSALVLFYKRGFQGGQLEQTI